MKRRGKRGASDTSPPSPRVVLHVDLDAFFVQVERSLNPTLIGEPMAVQQHGDIIAVSYEARRLGVTKHMPPRTIRQQYPSVKLIHVETIGLQNSKVSYRNYRKAARAIFTLVRAFCPPEDGGNSFRGGAGGAGTFQKTSVDEAYLEPSRRTLAAELVPSGDNERSDRTPPCSSAPAKKVGALCPPSSSSSCAPAEDAEGRGLKRPISKVNGVCGPFAPAEGHGSGGESATAAGDTSGCALNRRCGHFGDDEMEASEGGGSLSAGGENALELAVAESPDDGRPEEARKKRRGGGGGLERHARADDEEEERLLEAGGLLGRRIQRALSEVLKYDCSVGVAPNKFLAKLATNMAKPKGVRVLIRRDVSYLLASTDATKIPGCGPGSMAAKQFAAWGASTMLDLRRIDSGELRERLGEQLGAKVYDRCRGIDNDPVEPDPVPSRVSSQLALVPLISPAHCLGKPGEKMTPVFPWEVERLRPFLTTLVDDLIDRAKEEVIERSRRPTKVCLEYHLHQRGSKSQTFVLPPAVARGRPPPAPTGEALAEEQAPSVAPELDVEKEAGLPPAASLVELLLAPFKSYRQTRTIGGGGGDGGGGGGGTREAGGEDNRRNKAAPVVKLNVSLLGFVNLGLAAPVSAPPGQRTLRGMAWLGRDAPSTSASLGRQGGNSNEADRSSGNQFPDEIAAAAAATATAAAAAAAAAAPVAPVVGPPIGQHIPISPINTSAVDHRAGGAAALLDGTPTRLKGGVSDSPPPPQVSAEGSVLVRCPRCRACLPLGDVWDSHREEHLLILKQNSGLRWSENIPPTGVPPREAKTPALHGVLLSPQPSTVSPSRESSGVTGLQAPGGTLRKGDVGSARRTRSSRAVDRRRDDDDDGRGGGRRTRLSDLLLQAVSPAEAADVLKKQGLLRLDGQTRFAHLCFAEGQQQSVLDG